MEVSGNTILITGGATGIGRALVEAFVKRGNRVIICGRREDRLEEAKRKIKGLEVRKCDVSEKWQREELFDYIKENFPEVNILINNAGIQRAIDLKNPENLEGEDEIEINLRSVVHFSSLFAPLFKGKKSAIINVSSGLGFVPIAKMPVYCATKAAVHSFTLSLRRQLKDTTINVFEVIPPIVDTELDHGRRGNANRGIPASEVSKAVLEGIESGENEIVVGLAKGLRNSFGEDFERNFERMNSF